MTYATMKARSGRPSRALQRTTFPRKMARDTWRQARIRVRDDDCVDADRSVYEYVGNRSLMESLELGCFGILASGMALPEAISWWPSAGYRIVAPTYDHQGEIANIQARAIVFAEKKTLFPKGSKASGTVFASASGLDLLRGRARDARAVLLAEGLTDYLALSIVATVPVLSAPGVGLAESCVGPWARNRDVVLALDADDAGRKAIAPTARKLYQLEARSVHALVWPKGCCDACDALEALGEGELFEFLARHLLEVAA